MSLIYQRFEPSLQVSIITIRADPEAVARREALIEEQKKRFGKKLIVHKENFIKRIA